jgi:hypothetical protein
MFFALIFVVIDTRHELGEMKSSGQVDDKGAIPVGWPELQDPNDQSASRDSTHWDGRRRVRMIGYMMDGYHPSRDGEQVRMFILLPAAGQFLGAAPRIPNQMVEVRPRHPVVFKYGDLVWASGALSLTIVSLGDEKAAYSMMVPRLTLGGHLSSVRSTAKMRVCELRRPTRQEVTDIAERRSRIRLFCRSHRVALRPPLPVHAWV